MTPLRAVWLAAALLWLLAAPLQAAAPADADAFGAPYTDLDHLKVGAIVHLPTGRELTETDVVDLAARARVVYIGEMHSNLEHHKAQLAVIKALQARAPGTLAIGMEMFQRPAQPKLDQWTRGALDAKAFKALWYDNWSEDYAAYAEILDYAKAQHIPLVALNASDEQVHALSERGWSGLSKADRDWLGPVDEKDPYHRRAMEAMFSGHSHSGTPNFERFYRTMVLWDETMAASGADYLKSPAGKGKTLIVLAGGFHIGYGYGIPRRLFRRLPEPYVIILPQTPDTEVPEDLQMDVKPPHLPLYMADVLWVTGYSEAKSSRVRLGVKLDMNKDQAVVMELEPGGPADTAGIKKGDEIVSLSGQAIDSPMALIERLRLLDPGDTVKLKLLRGGQSVEVTVQFSVEPHPPAAIRPAP